MKLYGLIGYPLSHSFSQKYFTEKFHRENLHEVAYELYPLPSIDAFPELLRGNPSLAGLNVTIPYKEVVIPYLHDLSPEAQAVGAVNVIKFTKNALIGYNSDVFGFEKSLNKYSMTHDLTALILGTGGAAKAVAYVLYKLGIGYRYVSRNPGPKMLGYNDLDKDVLQRVSIIVNSSPLGMHPHVDQAPPIPYHLLTKNHLLYDLVYNPEKTLFLKLGEKQGARIQNGLEMLYFQAEKAWQIWNE